MAFAQRSLEALAVLSEEGRVLAQGLVGSLWLLCGGRAEGRAQQGYPRRLNRRSIQEAVRLPEVVQNGSWAGCGGSEETG